MSLSSALSAGTSGLLAQSSAFAAISDNIANVNTVGYKRAVTQFNPLVKVDSVASNYNAGGVQSSTRNLIAEQGLLQSTGVATDIGIFGEGFFVVSEVAAPSQISAYNFTRAGSFSPDANGDLQNAAGFFLQGWPVAADGTVNTDPSDLTQLETVNIAGVSGTAEATTTLQLNANLEAQAPLRPEAQGPVATYDSTNAALNMANYDPIAGTGVQPNFTAPVQIFDSLGALRTVNFAFLRQDPTIPGVNPNRWYVEAYVTPAADVATGAGLVNGQVAVGEIQFNADGTINTAASTFPTSLAIGASDDPAAAAPPANTVFWNPDLGVEAQTIALAFGGPASAGGLTQLSAPSQLDSTSVNGAVFGNLAGVEVDNLGFVVARFNNGVVRRIYQLPIATFPNPNGLNPTSGAAYEVTQNSGSFTLQQAGAGGAGEVSPAQLEASTVDLAAEFTGIITTQRAYSAASRIITTADEMLTELIQII